jgi:hypothetical protein
MIVRHLDSEAKVNTILFEALLIEALIGWP